MKYLIASLLLVTAFVSCKKDEKNTDTDTQSAQDNSLAESNYDDATVFIDLAAHNGSNLSFRQAAAREMGGCTTVAVDSAGTPHTISINFGTSNCLCVDGRNRRGKIIATYTGKYRDAGTVINISFDNYFVNDNQVKGTHKVTNMGNLTYKIEVDGQIVKANNGGIISWQSTRQREWLEGYSTPLNISDDTYRITGTANGTTASGDGYSIVITQPLVRKMNCRWLESGKLDVTPQGRLTRTLDYGNTGCDANATVTIAGVTFPIVLP